MLLLISVQASHPVAGLVMGWTATAHVFDRAGHVEASRQLHRAPLRSLDTATCLADKRRSLLHWRRLATGTRLQLGRKTELGASSVKTDDRTVSQWLRFTTPELDKLADGLEAPRAREHLETRLALAADGKSDSAIVSVQRLLYAPLLQLFKE